MEGLHSSVSIYLGNCCTQSWPSLGAAAKKSNKLTKYNLNITTFVPVRLFSTAACEILGQGYASGTPSGGGSAKPRYNIHRDTRVRGETPVLGRLVGSED